MVDSHGQEYYAIVSVEAGRKWRERRDEALAMIEDAILDKLPAGEVKIT